MLHRDRQRTTLSCWRILSRGCALRVLKLLSSGTRDAGGLRSRTGCETWDRPAAELALWGKDPPRNAKPQRVERVGSGA